MNQENLVTALDKLAERLKEAMEVVLEWKLMAQYLMENKTRMVEAATRTFLRNDPLSLGDEDEKVVLENLNFILDYLLEVARLNASLKPVGDIPPRESLRKNSKMPYMDIVFCINLLKDMVDCDLTGGKEKVLLVDCLDTLIEVFSN